MGCVQQEVLAFDEEILAPWRPRLVAVADPDPDADAVPARARRSRPSGRSSSRVGVCRPEESSRAPGAGPRRMPARPAAASARPVEGRVHRVSSSARPAPRAGLRLTRRARLLAAVVMLTLGVALGSWLGPLLAGSAGDLRLAGVQSVVVQPGDTLWSIAGDVAGGEDVRRVVDRIQELNGLSGTVLIPGQVLELP